MATACQRDGRKGVKMIAIQINNKDDVTEAVKGLDIFTKNWCMNCAETEKQGELQFRCVECEFLKGGCKCLVKTFATEHKHNYPMQDFGSMGEH